MLRLGSVKTEGQHCVASEFIVTRLQSGLDTYLARQRSMIELPTW